MSCFAAGHTCIKRQDESALVLNSVYHPGCSPLVQGKPLFRNQSDSLSRAGVVAQW